MSCDVLDNLLCIENAAIAALGASAGLRDYCRRASFRRMYLKKMEAGEIKSMRVMELIDSRTRLVFEVCDQLL